MKKITLICILSLGTSLPTSTVAEPHSPYPKMCYSMSGPGTTFSDAMKTRFKATADALTFRSLSSLSIRTAITEHRAEQCKKMTSGAPFEDQCPAGVTMDINDHATSLLDQHGSKTKGELDALVENAVETYQAAAVAMNEACGK